MKLSGKTLAESKIRFRDLQIHKAIEVLLYPHIVVGCFISLIFKKPNNIDFGVCCIQHTHTHIHGGGLGLGL